MLVMGCLMFYLEILKSLLIEEKKWKERSRAKKPEKDKVYKRTLEVIKMIKEIKL